MRNYTILTVSNNGEKLDRLLSSLTASQPAIRLDNIFVVVDEGLGAAIKQKWPVHYIHPKEGTGFANLFNAGLRAIPKNADIFFCSDHGILLTKHGIDQLRKTAYTNPSIGMSSPSIAGKTEQSYNSYQSIGELYAPTLHSALIEKPGYKSTLNFLAVYIKREALETVGTLPENILSYGYEDNYFCERMIDSDYDWIIDPEVVALFPDWEGFNAPASYNQTRNKNEGIGIENLYAVTSFYNEHEAAHPREQLLLNHVKKSILNAHRGISKINRPVLELEGMSSPKGRHLLNNLCSLRNANYLEIGTWKGSTLISALFGNQDTLSQAVAIDNWSRCGGPEKEFHDNCAAFLQGYPYRFLCKDSFEVDVKEIFDKTVDIYFYDGHHSALSHELAFTHYDPILADTFITVIDDWNWEEVRCGTLAAFEKLKYKIVFEAILPARWNRDVEFWWDGLYIALIRK